SDRGGRDAVGVGDLGCGVGVASHDLGEPLATRGNVVGGAAAAAGDLLGVDACDEVDLTRPAVGVCPALAEPASLGRPVGDGGECAPTAGDGLHHLGRLAAVAQPLDGTGETECRTEQRVGVGGSWPAGLCSRRMAAPCRAWGVGWLWAGSRRWAAAGSSGSGIWVVRLARVLPCRAGPEAMARTAGVSSAMARRSRRARSAQ